MCARVFCKYLTAPLVQEDRAWDIIEQLERFKTLFGILALEKLFLEVDLLHVNKVKDDNLCKNVLDRRSRDEDDVEIAEQRRIDQGQV